MTQKQDKKLSLYEKMPQKAYYSVFGFLASLMIETIDNLEGTDQYRHSLKQKLKSIQSELIKVNDDFFKRFISIDKQRKQLSLGEVTEQTPKQENIEIPMEDVYFTILKSYDYALDFFMTTPVSELPFYMKYLKDFREKEDIKDMTLVVKSYQE